MMKFDVKKLTLDEKLHLLTGADLWRTYGANGKIPQVFLSDGPNGLRMHAEDGSTKKATAMPTISVVANTWNPALSYLDGATIAEDCIEHGADVLLAPGVNIKRTPLNGRNFEYFSEDPFLAGTMAKAYIDGVQSKHVGTSLKHFCVNNREYDRFYQTSELDERALREIYCRPFEIAVKAQPWTVMCSYNPVNGVYASENKYLLKEILRDEFGFEGLIVSDWEAVHQSYKAVKATLDLRMPYSEKAYPELKAAYEKGLLTEEEIDYCVQNVLNLVEKKVQADQKKKETLTKEERHANAVEIAKEGIVLLKNEGVLPLKKGKVAVIGEFSESPTLGGGGSAYVQTDFKQKFLSDLIAEREGYSVQHEYCLGGREHGTALKKGYAIAYEADTVVISVGTCKEVECEGYDRTTIRLTPIMENFILETAKINPNVVVCLHAGSAVDMSAWVDEVKAVVSVGYAGEGTNEALSAILVGEVSPSGKLTETFPLSLDDTYTGEETGNGLVEWYSDGIFVGYRYYDKAQADVQFPFGHGLSYANFVYSDLKIKQCGESEFEVSYQIENTSEVDAKEVSQVYVKQVFPMVVRPEKELKGFSKDLIKAGEKKTVTVKLDFRSFAYYNTAYRRWHAENGPYEIYVGASSRDLRLCGKVTLSLDDATQQSKW
ncbi:MAG: glycoside hydrolase family 3 protein [Clostridia bacterium]|nr:glycoside hydrolase family 3 protein [Clostridia bacterium]